MLIVGRGSIRDGLWTKMLSLVEGIASVSTSMCSLLELLDISSSDKTTKQYIDCCKSIQFAC